MKNKTFYVTRPKLPALGDFTHYLEKIWKTSQLTNNGVFHNDLERKLSEYLEVDHLVLYSSGTAALVAAIKCAGVSGEVITTPYTFIATTHAISMCGLEPVFVDVNKDTANLDIRKVEDAITNNTGAVLAVACYGNPDGFSELSNLCRRHNISFLSDSAHAFDVRIKTKSIFTIPDLSAVSFHATKVFSTIEGGAVICKTKEMANKLRLFRNFGIESEERVSTIGGNGKLNELCAAYGLLQLDTISEQISSRNRIRSEYERRLKGHRHIQLQAYDDNVKQNGSYFPILLSTPKLRDYIYDELKEMGIYTRKYFYPLVVNTEPYKKYFKKDMFLNSIFWAEHVLCLPIYPQIHKDEQDYIINSLIQKINEF